MATQPRSTLDELAALSADLQSALDAVLDHSEVFRAWTNSEDSAVFIFGNPFEYRPLAREHQPLIARARKLLTTSETLSEAAVRASAPSRLDAFREHSEVLREVVEQQADAKASSSSADGVRKLVAKAIEDQRDMLHDLPSAHGTGELLMVPDTNSAVYQPAFEKWNPSDDPWTLVLVPQVIRELDELKVRDRPVAEAAASVIRRVEGYADRGDTFEGVPLRKGARFREVAIEADMEQAPPWLRAGHADDELLASVLELRWEDLTTRIVLVTRDRNLKNKARLSRVAYLGVEDIAEPRPQRERRNPERDAQLEREARERLGGALPWVRSKLDVPPASRATNPNQQSWTIHATPLVFDAHQFRAQVLGPDASEWFQTRAYELFAEPTPLPSSAATEEPAQAGIAFHRDFAIPLQGSVLLVADAGGIVGVRHYVEADPNLQRALILSTVEEEEFRPLIETCADALTMLGTTGRVLLEAWVRGVSDTRVLTVGHTSATEQREGWLKEGFLHFGGEVTLPADAEAVEELVSDWGRQFARAAGIAAHEPTA